MARISECVGLEISTVIASFLRRTPIGILGESSRWHGVRCVHDGGSERFTSDQMPGIVDPIARAS